MKNLMNSKSILVLVMCTAFTLFLASACAENRTVDSKEMAERDNIAKVNNNDSTIIFIQNDSDAKFLMAAAEMQLAEISLGKLAQEKGNSPHVKELGKMMEQNHSTTFSELQALAQSKSVSIPTTITEESKDAYNRLVEKSGNEFGKAYSDMMVEHHEDAVALFEKAAADAEDSDVRSWASDKLPSMRAHLESAVVCKAKCDKMKS